MLPVQVRKIHTITGHRDCVYTLQPSDNDHQFFSAGGDGLIALWNLEDPENGELVARLPSSVYALHFHRDSGMLIAGQNFQGIHWLDWKNKREAGSLQLTSAAIFDIQSAGDRLFVASGEGVVTVVDIAQMRVTERIVHSEKSARTIAIDSNSGDIAVGYSDNYIRVFDRDLKLRRAWPAHTSSVFALRYMPDSGLLMSGSRDARLKVWDPGSDYALKGEVVAHLFAINHLDFSPDAKHFVTCSMDKSIKVWDAAELRLLKVIDRARHAGHGTSVNKLLWTSFNNQLISASDDRTISVWHIIF